MALNKLHVHISSNSVWCYRSSAFMYQGSKLLPLSSFVFQSFHWTSSHHWVTFRCTRRMRPGSRSRCRDLQRVSAGWKAPRSCRVTKSTKWSRRETFTFCWFDQPSMKTRQSTCLRPRTRGRPANSSYKVTLFFCEQLFLCLSTTDSPEESPGLCVIFKHNEPIFWCFLIIM